MGVIPFLLVLLVGVLGLKYPISLPTVRTVNMRRSPEELVRQLGIPNVRNGNGSSSYQFISLDGWTLGKGYGQACELWVHAEKYFGRLTRYGSSTADIQAYLRGRYAQAGAKVLVTAFGAGQFPCSERLDWKTAADELALFVKANGFDGAVVEFEDVSALLNEDAATAPASNWLVSFLGALRQHLPAETLVLQLYASLLQPTLSLVQYVNQLVGSLDFFVVKYYNVVGDYSTIQSTFYQATVFQGTSVR